MSRLKKAPLFIVGAGRSGSSVFHQILSKHSDFSWISSILEKSPKSINLHNRLTNLTKLPIIGRQVIGRKVYASEAYPFWDDIARGFSEPCRDLVAGDVTPKTKKKVREVFEQLTRRDQLLVKLTGWPRISYLQEIFPDAKFIHIIRDGRSVVNSTLNVPWWTGWKGPNHWGWGPLNAQNERIWNQYDQSFVALAAIGWNIIMDSFEEAKNDASVDNGNYMEIRYEDLCSDPINFFEQVLQFNDTCFNERFSNIIDRYNLRATNDKWNIDLTAKQRNIIENVSYDNLTRYNYL